MHLIRLATLSDIDVLAALMQEYYAEAGMALPEHSAGRALEQLLDDSRLGQVWVIEHDNNPAGFVVVTVSFSMQFGGLRGVIDYFFIRPRYRRMGLGHAALEEVKRTCRRRGLRALMVEISRDNTAGFSAYHSVGFRDSGAVLLLLQLTDS